jgi:hypothetical protein
MNPEPDLTDDVFARTCRERPLGAYYRVDAFRLDDMQSAINELYAVAVSGAVHDGWRVPVIMKDPVTKKDMHVIVRSEESEALGGHAYILVGYNQVGFMVQNSWGTAWGDGGFATLPYDDWLDSAYDAWVARPGVPQTPFARPRTRTAAASFGDLATAPGTDLHSLQAHVIDLANNGRLSQSGKFTSWPGQIHRAFAHMDESHARWAREGDRPRRVVLYAHGGVVDEALGLKIAQQQLGWWLNNHVYPLFFVWESGPLETAANWISDRVNSLFPFRAAGWDLWEGMDRLVEGLSRDNFWWMWGEMKQNAAAASGPIAPSDAAKLRWPPRSTVSIEAMAAMPGASLVADRLRRYRERHPETEVSLVGHSAGTILIAALARRLAPIMPIHSMSFMGSALRADEFRDTVLPRVRSRRVKNFANFVLSDKQELDDKCDFNGVTFYHKSLLYLVSRGFERPDNNDNREIGLVGMARSLAKPVAGAAASLDREIQAAGGAVVVSPSSGQPGSNSAATGHASFDEDMLTMGSVLFRILGRPGSDFEANAEPAPPAIVNQPPPAPARPAESVPDIAAFSTGTEGAAPKSDLAPTSRSDVLQVLESEGFETVELSAGTDD